MSSIPLRPAVGIAVMLTVSILTAVAAHLSRSSPTTESEPSLLDAPGSCLAASAMSGSDAGNNARADSGPQHTNHGKLILDGHFAQRIGLLSAFKGVALHGKTVLHTPEEHLSTAFVNILAGHSQLQQISRGQTPLRVDLALAHAWGQEQFPDVSGVCRQLHALDWEMAEALRCQLRGVFDPYVALCRGRACNQGERLVVDWDLTAKGITTDATSEPYAAYGHMESGLGKGYQWAETTLRGRSPEGEARPVCLGGFLRPGNAHALECMERLRLITEASLGRPRRRPELLGGRLDGAKLQSRQQAEKVELLRDRVEKDKQRLGSVKHRLRTVRERQEGAANWEELVSQAMRRVQKAQQRLEAAQGRLGTAEARLEGMDQTVEAMAERLARLRAKNEAIEAGQLPAAAIELVMDAGFGGSEQVATLIEEGYELTTKAISPATVSTLLRREARGEALFGPWEEVSANAQVAESAETRYAACPYPLRLLGYRKELAGSESREAHVSHALVLTTVPAK